MAEINNEKKTVVEAKVVSASSSVDYGRALTWYFKDKNFWPTTLKASLYFLSCILILPIFYVGPVMVGYMLELIRNIQNGVYELPEELGSEGQWKEGIILTLVTMGISFLLSSIFSFGPSASTSFSEALNSTQGGADSFDFASLAGASMGAGAGLLSYLVQILTIFVNVILFSVYAKTKDIGSLIKVDNYASIFKKNGSKLAVLTIVIFVVSKVVPIIGMLALCVGILPAIFVSAVINASLYGQVDVSDVE